jgi:AhpD family alkylhydroperoxidase
MPTQSDTISSGRTASMSKDFARAANDVIMGVGSLREVAPETMKAFAGLATEATASGVLDTRIKELMALAISIAVHCDGCVAYHAKMAHKNGASRDEVAETIALAIYMGGGPAAVYGADGLRAYDVFAAE